MLDFYYSKAEFHLIRLDKNYEVTTHKISKKQINMLAKVEYENDLAKMKSMYDFIKKTILSVVV